MKPDPIEPDQGDQAIPAEADATETPRSRRFRRWAIALVLCAAVVLVIGYRSALSPGRVKIMTESALMGMIGGEVQVDRAKLSLMSGELTIEGFRWSASGVPDAAGQLASAETIRLRFDRGALLSMQVEPLSVELINPTVSLIEIDNAGQLNWAAHAWPARDEDETGAPIDIPEVRITGGRYQTGRFESDGAGGGTFTPDHIVNFAGTMRVDETDPTKLAVDFYELSEHRPTEKGVHVTAAIDPVTHAVEGKIEGIKFVDRYRNMMPPAVRALWRDLEPRGELPVVTFVNDPQRGPSAELAVEGVSFNLPKLTDNERRVRMEQMTGRFRFTSRGIEIIEEVTGVVEGGAHRLAGSFGGFSLGAPFRLSLKTDEFELPEEPTFIYALPEQVQKAFGMIAPSGRLRVSMAVFRDQPGAQMTYEGTATLLGGKGRLDRFPYPLTGCRGIIKFNRDEVRVLNLTGDASAGGTVTVTGRIWPPGEFPAIDMIVTAVDLQFNEVLYDAMKPGQRNAVKMLFDRTEYDRLKANGHFVSVEQYNAAELEAAELRREIRGTDDDTERANLQQRLDETNLALETPAFELGGRGDVIVRIQREPGPDARSTAEIDLTVHEASCVFKYFPYPVNATGGRIHISPRTLEIVDGKRIETPPVLTFEDIEANGLRGGMARLRGTIKTIDTPDPNKKEIAPEVRVVAVGLPVDDLLLDCLPNGQDKVLRKLKIAGEIDVSGTVFDDEQGKVDTRMLIEMTDGTAAPGDGSLPITGVNARLRTSLKKAELLGMTAKHPRGMIEATGTFDFTNPDEPRTHLTGRVTNLEFKKVPFGAVSELIEVNDDWQAFLTKHDASGVFDAKLELRPDGAGQSQRQLTIHPRTLGFAIDDRPVSLENVTGEIIVKESGARLDQLSGELDGGAVVTNGTIGFDMPRLASLKLSAKGERVTDELKNVLPRVLGDLLTRLRIDGKYDLNLDRLLIRPDAQGDGVHTDLHGIVKLTGGTCTLGMEMADINGSLEVTAEKRAGSEWPRLQATLAGESLAVNGRRITELKGSLKSATDPSCLLVPELRGRMYGGAVGGSGVVDLATRRYQMRLMMSGIELASFAAATPDEDKARPESDIAEPRPDVRDPKASRPLSGKLSAAIDLEGDWGKPDSVRGRGGIQVKQGVMFDLPLSVGALQMVNLSLPVNRAFDRAEIAYLLKDRMMVFERIGLHSSVKVEDEQYTTNLSLQGKGTLDLDTEALDITLTTNNPGGIDMGPLSDLLDGFKDQLITIRVGGTITEPQTRVEQLSALTDAWQDVFGEGDPN